MAVTITPNIQAHVDLLKSLNNITSVEVKSVPDNWKAKINNVESVMFVIHKGNLYMDLVVPLAIADGPIDTTLLQYPDRFSILINGLIDKMGYEDCIMCVNNDFLESFYYMNPQNNLVEEIENTNIKVDLSPLEKNLVRYLLTVPFVKEVFVYNVIDNPSYVLISCNIVNLSYTGSIDCPLDNLYCPPHGTRYKVLVPTDVLTDLSLQKMIVSNLVTYYNKTVDTASSGLYHPDSQPILPDHLKDMAT